MANSNNSGLVFFTMMLLGVGVVGGYMYMRKRSTNVPPAAMPVDALGNPLATGAALINEGSPWYGAVQFTAGGPVPSVLDTTIRAGVPITSGSKRGYDADRFAKTALGTCQCDERECCYKAFYQPKHGGPETEKVCDDVHYNDYLETCDSLVEKFNRRTNYASAYTGSMGRKTAAFDPYRTFLTQRHISNMRS